MQRFHAGPDAWKAVTKAVRASAGRRRAAIAFVTTAGESLLPLRRGDELVVNASEHSLRSHATDPRGLLSWAEKGVKIWSREDLHAKVIVADNIAVVGSANASLSASSRLVEAVLITDSRAVIRELHEFIDRVQQKPAQQAPEELLHVWQKVYESSSPRWGVPGANVDPEPQSEVGAPPWTIRVVEALEYASHAAEETFARERKSVTRQPRGFEVSFLETERETASDWVVGDLLAVLWRYDGDDDVLDPPSMILGVRDVPRTNRCIVLYRHDPKMGGHQLDDVNMRLTGAGERRILSTRVIRSQSTASALLGCWDLP